MIIRFSALCLAAMCLLTAAYGAEEIKLDLTKYPQDTPEHTMSSMVKALETDNALGYWISYLVTPDHTQRMIEKYKTIDAAVAANQDEKHVNGRKQLVESIKKMLEAKTTSEGEANGVKWFCYKLGDSLMVQLEKQKDGRWCMNPRAQKPSSK